MLQKRLIPFVHRRGMLVALALLTAGAAVAATNRAHAQSDWPKRPITLIVSQSAGASPDVFARHMAERLRPLLNQSVIVENKPGGGNAIGAVAAARSAPDGHTFFFATSAALTMNPFLMKNLPYDPLKDFVPVALVTRSHQVVVAHPDFPGKDLAGLIAEVKKNPNKYSVAIDGPRNLSGVIMKNSRQQGWPRHGGGALHQHPAVAAGGGGGAAADRHLLASVPKARSGPAPSEPSLAPRPAASPRCPRSSRSPKPFPASTTSAGSW